MEIPQHYDLDIILLRELQYLSIHSSRELLVHPNSLYFREKLKIGILRLLGWVWVEKTEDGGLCYSAICKGECDSHCKGLRSLLWLLLVDWKISEELWGLDVGQEDRTRINHRVHLLCSTLSLDDFVFYLRFDLTKIFYNTQFTPSWVTAILTFGIRAGLLFKGLNRLKSDPWLKLGCMLFQMILKTILWF